MKSGRWSRRNSSATSHASRNSASVAPGGSGRLSLLPSALPAPRSCAWPVPGIEEATVLVNIDDDQVGVVLVGVEDAVAVMNVDIDIGDAAHAVLVAQGFDHHTEIVDHAESCRRVAARMVQPADRLKAARDLAADDARQRIQRRAADCAGRLEHAGKARGVAVVEPAFAGLRAEHHPFDMRRGVKAHQFLRAWRSAVRALAPSAASRAAAASSRNTCWRSTEKGWPSGKP